MLRSGSVEERILRPLVLARPVRLAWPPSWAGHIPFAFWIVEASRPATFVELGTHSGVSYGAFVQAVLSLHLSTACYAVDTWAGDSQAGFYGEDVYEEWAAFHDRHFGGQSRLVRSTFDEAADKFSDGSIDLLHIDGLHTYEAVRHDFDTWRSKLSHRAVVLFHDINVRERDFGVWKLWEELRVQYPSFSFVHGHGLGVLSTGPEIPGDIAWLASLSTDSAEKVQRLFSTVGDLWSTHISLAQAQKNTAAAAEERRHLRATLEGTEARLAASTIDVERLRTDVEIYQQAEQRVAADHASLTEQVERLTAELATYQQAEQRVAADHASLAEQVERLTAELSAYQQVAVDHVSFAEQGDRLSSDLVNADQEAAALEHAAWNSAIAQLIDDTHSAALDNLSLRELTRALEIASAHNVRLRNEAFLGHLQSIATMRAALVNSLGHASTADGAAPPLTSQLRRRAAALGLTRRGLVKNVLGAGAALIAGVSGTFRQRIALLKRSGLFDPSYYAAHPEVRTLPRTRLREHFVRHGDRAGLSPHPLFNAGWYRERNADLPQGEGLLQHYLNFGSAEDRDPHPLFSSAYYRSQRPEQGSAVSLLTHYLRGGAARALSPHPLFDLAHYLLQYPALPASGQNPLMHYLAHAWQEMADPHPLFATRYYLATNPDITPNVNPLAHFVQHGAGEGRNPHPLFDVGFYLSQRPDVRAGRINALMHYLSHGAFEGTNPHPLFDTDHYASQLPADVPGTINPLVHFVGGGWRWGLTPNPWFDPLWYLERNRDVDPNTNPLRHYAEYGWREGRDPSPRFSTSRYLNDHPEVVASREDPLAHFLRRNREDGWHLPPVAAATSRNVFQVSGRAETPRTIVVVSHVLPWPVRAGNDYRLQRLLRHWIREGYRLVLVLAPLPGEPPAPDAFDRIADEFGNVVLCQADGRVQYRLRDCPDVIARLADMPVRVASPEDASYPFGGDDPGFCHDAVYAVGAALLQALGRVTLVAEYIFMTRVMSAVGSNVLKVVDTIDVFSQKGTNVIAFGINDTNIPPADEARRLRRADVVVAIHEGDARVLATLAPDREVLVAGVDADVLAERSWPAQQTVFVAGSGNPLNLAGMRDFLRYAWPHVRESVPHATLRIAGGIGRAVPPGTIGVDVLGHVPDLATEYAEARVVINPTVAGTGLKIKTVEAIAHLVPVVCWPHGRDGLSKQLGQFVYESQDWRDFADAVIRTLRSETSPFDGPAIAHVRRELSPRLVYEALDRRLEAFFTGAAR